MFDKNKLKNLLENVQPSSIPFWSWNNELDKGELVKEIRHMHKTGYGGFILHARTGLKTEYLGDKWFDCVAAVLAEAKKLDMEAWIYDENGWPSGFVGGKLLEREEFRAKYLEYKISSVWDDQAFCAYKKDGEKFVLLHNPQREIAEYHLIYLRTSPANTDILNPDVVDAFIAATHEQYYKRFPQSFGKELVGFFTDEPQYYRYATPYTSSLDSYFDSLNISLKENLIYLFIQHSDGYKFRTLYYRRLNYLYNNVYYKKLFDWCTAHNVKLTGHSVEEGNLALQMLGGAGVMPSYHYEHIPAIDWLGRHCGTELAPKQLGSVASQLGIGETLTETFACSGYDVNLWELKSLGDFQFFNGVTKMCQHLYPMSISKQGKFDHPPIFSSHVNLDDEFAQFNKYFDRLGYIVSHSKENYDVGIIHPLRNVYLDYIRANEFESVKELEENFQNLLVSLRKNGVTFQLIDETLFEEFGSATDGKLKVGQNLYDTVIIPPMKSISSDVYNALQQFDGRLLVMGELSCVDGEKQKVNLCSNTTFEEIVQNAAVKFSCKDGNSFVTSRSADFGDFLFVKNLSYGEKSVVQFQNVAEHYCKLDILSCELSPISNSVELSPSEGIILVKTNAVAQRQDCVCVQQDITSNFAVSNITNNYLTLDNAALSFDGKNFSCVKSVQQIFEDLLRSDFKGDIYIRHTFEVVDIVSATLVVEQQDYKYLTVNNHAVTPQGSQFDFYFCECDITQYLKLGENIIEYCMNFYQHDGVHFALFDPEATESLRNCLCFDTSIEPCYLKGDFALNCNFALCKKAALPVTDKMFNHGYNFFFGNITYCGEYLYNGGEAILNLTDGRYLSCLVKVNGTQLPFSFDGIFNLTPYLKMGQNTIEITLKSSLRNLLGPHHFKYEKDPMGVAPIHFTMRGTWGDGISSLYIENYNFVPFGLNSISVKKLEYKI